MMRYLTIAMFAVLGVLSIPDDADAGLFRRRAARSGGCAAVLVSAPVARRAVVRERHILRSRGVVRGES